MLLSLCLFHSLLFAEQPLPPELAKELKQVQLDSLNIVQFQKFAAAIHQETAQLFAPLPGFLQAYIKKKITFKDLEQALTGTEQQLQTLRIGMQSFPLYKGMSQSHFNRLFQSQQNWAQAIQAYQESLAWERKYLDQPLDEYKQARQKRLQDAKALNLKARRRLRDSLLHLEKELEEVKRKVQGLKGR